MTSESLLPSTGCVLAYVDEGGSYEQVLRIGRTLARETVSALVLFEAEPADGADARARLPEELLSLDRTALAEAVARARDEGIDAWGWVAAPDDPDALATCAREVDPSVIVLPVELEDGELPAGWREDRLTVVDDGSVNLVMVDREGHLVGPA